MKRRLRSEAVFFEFWKRFGEERGDPLRICAVIVYHKSNFFSVFRKNAKKHRSNNYHSSLYKL